MTPVAPFPGKHFSEIFCQTLDFQLTVFSRGGMSNGGILIQLLSAIKSKPDLIIFNTTTVDRIEFPTRFPDSKKLVYDVKNLLYNYPTQQHSSQAEWMNKNVKVQSNSLLSLLRKNIYDPNLGPYDNHHSENYDTITNLEDKIKAIKTYYEFLYDHNMKNMIDSVMMYGIIHHLQTTNIPFVFVQNQLDNVLPYEFTNPKNDISYKFNTIIGPNICKNPKQDPGFHTNFETQVKLANLLIEHYRNNFTQN